MPYAWTADPLDRRRDVVSLARVAATTTVGLGGSAQLGGFALGALDVIGMGPSR